MALKCSKPIYHFFKHLIFRPFRVYGMGWRNYVCDSAKGKGRYVGEENGKGKYSLGGGGEGGRMCERKEKIMCVMGTGKAVYE